MKKLLIFFFLILPLFALDNCPFGLEDDPYPGECGKYVDIDNNSFCDHAQSEYELASLDKLTPEPILIINPNVAKKYNSYLISLILLCLYFMSFTLSKQKIINKFVHRKIWNVLLLFSFLISGITGLFLAFGITLLPNFLTLHVQTGIIMAIISIFHILWHIPYFKTMKKKSIKNSKNLENNFNINST